jgi:hypothetical protein
MDTHCGGSLRPGESPRTRTCETEFEARPDSPSAVEDVWRSLDTGEALFATFNAVGAFLTAQVLEVHGPVTETLLVKAFAHLEKRHRVLRARITSRGGSMCWAEGAAISPRISIIDHAPPGGLEALTEMELHRMYSATHDRLWRCTWIPLSRDRHWIILALHHAVADGISSMIIVRDLLATCSALVGVGELPPDLPAGRTLDEVLPPVTWLALLRHRARRLRSRLLGPPPILPIERSAPPEERRTRVIFGTVPGDLMLALQAGARSRHATINGVLAAALLESVREVLGRLPLVPVNHSVNMRGSAIPQNQVGCFVSNIITRHPLRARWSFWREAQSATAQLHRALDRGDAAAALLATRGKVAAAAAMMRRAVDDPRTAGRIGALSIANRGVISDLSAGPFRVAAWYPATSNHTFGNGIQVSCGTVGQTLFFSLMYVMPLLSVASARRIADGFRECLMHVARNLPSDRYRECGR